MAPFDMAAFEDKLAKVTKIELLESQNRLRAEDLITYSRLLLEQVGKERAIDLVKKARWDARHGIGKASAEKLGNPKEVHTFIKEQRKRMATLPQVPPSEILEETKNSVTVRQHKCFLAEAILKQNLDDKDLMDVLKAYCNHDEGYAAGWNLKCTKLKFLMDGDASCDFLYEAEE